MNRLISGAAAGAVAAVIVLTVVAASEPPPASDVLVYNDKIGLAVNAPSQTVSLRQLDEAFLDASSTGIGRTNVYLFWNIIEPERGEFDWSQSDVLIGLSEKNDLRVTLFFSVVNGKILGPFPDWTGNPSLDSIGADRLADVLDAILLRYDIIDTVIIGGSTESQFRYNEQDIPAYRDLFNGAYEILKEKHPDVMFGNSFALHHVINKNLDHVVGALAVGDVVAFSYLPVDSLNDIVMTPAETAGDLEQAINLAAGKPVGFLKVSWSTSDFVGWDEDSQSEFVKRMFEFYSDNESEIEFLTWGRQHDRPEGTCVAEQQDIGSERITVGGDSILGTSEFVIERLDRYICSSGLVDVEGMPKPAWNEFKNQIGMINPG